VSDKQFSDEFLNAFVDDQLAPDEKSRAYPQISENEALNRRVCELRKVRDLVQLAYKNPPSSPRRALAGVRASGIGNAIAAGLLLFVGIALGWTLHKPVDGTSTPEPQEALRGVVPAVTKTPLVIAHNGARSQEAKVLFHLSSGNVDRMREVLDEAEGLLKLYRESHQAARVEIVANGRGVNLLRSDVSPYAARIRELHARYPNLTFAACENSLAELEKEEGFRAHLVPEATRIDSGVATIIELQQEGWAYIQV
jgi:intracellular sulfur oxidation DsrE/DsrF family protein